MDTIYMRERAYRVVETLRRENKREQRRLDDRLFSKQGLAASHQMELTALTEEQRRVKQELSRIKKSTSTTWGLLPPRQGEPDHDEQLLWELSTRRTHRGERRPQRTRHRSLADQRRPNEPCSFNVTDSDLSCVSFESSRHYSDPGPLSPVPPPGDGGPGGDARRTQRLRKKSVKQWDEENRRTEETLKKFNEAFPSDGKVGVMQLPPGVGGEGGSEEVDGGPSGGVTPRKTSRVEGKPDQGHGLRESGTRYNSRLRRESMASGVHQPTPGAITGAENFAKRMSTTTITIIREDSSLSKKSSSSLGSTPTTRRRDSTTRPPLAARRLSSSGNTSVPKALELLGDEDAGSESRSPKKASALQLYPITVVDVQEARDNIVRRLVGNNFNSTKRRADSPRALRTLSPIREQKTELNLMSASMPQFTTSFPDSPPTKPKKGRKKGDQEEQEEGPQFDSYRYNPDGTVRTMHLLPDFSQSLEEAMKARYIRHSEKQWFERELNVTEIFKND